MSVERETQVYFYVSFHYFGPVLFILTYIEKILYRRFSSKFRETLLVAANIMPVSDFRNNLINNGMALTPTLHLTMDRHLIAPGPDYQWHVSDFVREQAESDEGARQIAELHKAPIKLPKDPVLKPTQSILEWSFEHLIKF